MGKNQTGFGALGLIIVIIILSMLGLGAWRLWGQGDKDNFEPSGTISSFDECVAAGYPVLESFPEQCTVPNGDTFTKDEPSQQMTQGTNQPRAEEVADLAKLFNTDIGPNALSNHSIFDVNVIGDVQDTGIDILGSSGGTLTFDQTDVDAFAKETGLPKSNIKTGNYSFFFHTRQSVPFEGRANYTYARQFGMGFAPEGGQKTILNSSAAEPIGRSELSTVFFADEKPGWQSVDAFFTPQGFSPLPNKVFVFFDPSSTVIASLVPQSLIGPSGTEVSIVTQLFVRETPTGQQPDENDSTGVSGLFTNNIIVPASTIVDAFPDILDSTSGGGTADTANTYADYTFGVSVPASLVNSLIVN